MLKDGASVCSVNVCGCLGGVHRSTLLLHLSLFASLVLTSWGRLAGQWSPRFCLLSPHHKVCWYSPSSQVPVFYQFAEESELKSSSLCRSQFMRVKIWCISLCQGCARLKMFVNSQVGPVIQPQYLKANPVFGCNCYKMESLRAESYHIGP